MIPHRPSMKTLDNYRVWIGRQQMSPKNGDMFTLSYWLVVSNIVWLLLKSARVVCMRLNWTKTAGDSWCDAIGQATVFALLIFIVESSRIARKRARESHISNSEDATMI
jgi:hypothetical protein